MNSVIEELRDAAQAAQAGEPVGHRRYRLRHSFEHETATTTRFGTHLPPAILLQVESDPSNLGPTGDTIVSESTRALVDSGSPKISRTDGLSEVSSLYRRRGGADWGGVLSAAFSAMPAAIASSTSPVAGVLATAGVAELALAAVRSWQANRRRTPEEIVATLPEAGPIRQHAGLAAIEWLRRFLHISLDRCFRIAHVSPATYYSWRSKPDTVVRPNTVEALLRVTASIRLLESAVGASTARQILIAGSPNLLDQLSEGSEEFEGALRAIFERAQPSVERLPPRMEEARSILDRLRSLDVAAAANADPRPLGSARQPDEQAVDGIDGGSDIESGA